MNEKKLTELEKKIDVLKEIMSMQQPRRDLDIKQNEERRRG